MKTICIPLFSSGNDTWNSVSETFQKRGGVYKVFAMREAERVPTNRLLKQDINGVLYIGKANSFLKRVIDLKKTLSPDYKSEAHIMGRRYHLEYRQKLRLQFPLESLWVELIESDNPISLEKAEIKKYVEEFGETPPLNALE